MKKIIPLLVLLLVACGAAPGHQVAGDATSNEDEAVGHLYYVLNSDEGHMMTASQLAHQDGYEYNSYFAVNLPITNQDETPLFDTPYIDKETGSTIVFHQETVEGDTIRPIGTADLRTVIHDWQEQAPDTADHYRVHARGNGLYTFYNIRHQNCYCRSHDKHPDGFPEYEACIVWIKPGGKELLITWGYKRSERTYHAK